jgi:hypothetical protein
VIKILLYKVGLKQISVKKPATTTHPLRAGFSATGGKIMKRKLLPVIVLGLVLLSAAAALADGDIYVGGPWGTQITKLPYEIKTPGAYYLGGNLSSAGGNGIHITSDHVTLDLMGFNLNGPGDSNGIYMGGHTNVEIRNGTITNWGTGIWESSGTASCHRILNVRLSGCNYGMTVYGNGHVIKGCEASGNPGVRGIWIGGGTISGCRASNFNYEGMGLVSGGIMRGNVVTGNAAATSRGLVIQSEQGLIVGNEVTNCAVGLRIGSATSALNNTVTTASTNEFAGIEGQNDVTTVLDQNTVMGTGTHTLNIGGAQTRNNAGFP